MSVIEDRQTRRIAGQIGDRGCFHPGPAASPGPSVEHSFSTRRRSAAIRLSVAKVSSAYLMEERGRPREGSGRSKEGSGRSREGSGRPRKGSGRSEKGSGRSRKGSGRPRKGSGRSRKGSGRSRKGSGRSRKGSGKAPLVVELVLQGRLMTARKGGVSPHDSSGNKAQRHCLTKACLTAALHSAEPPTSGCASASATIGSSRQNTRNAL